MAGAKIADLLGSMYIHYPGPEGMPSIPKFEEDRSAYTDERAKQDLQYADCRLRDIHRIVPPMTQKILMELKASSIVFLSAAANDPWTKQNTVHAIQFIEREFLQLPLMRASIDSKEEILLRQMLKFRQLQLRTDYGRYLMKITTAVARTATIGSWYEKDTGKYVRDIAAKLLEESKKWQDWAQVSPMVSKDDLPTHLSMANAAKLLGMNPTLLLEAVKRYGKGKGQMYDEVEGLFEQGDDRKLALKLEADLTELEYIFPNGISREQEVVRLVIMTLIERWFFPSLDPNDPKAGNWLVTRKWFDDSLAMKKLRTLEPAHFTLVALTVEEKIDAAISQVFLVTGNTSSGLGGKPNREQRLKYWKRLQQKQGVVASEFKIGFHLDTSKP